MPFDRPSANCIHVFRHMPGPANVMTVSGPIAADRLGFTLIHEHLLLDLMRDAWIGNNILNDPELALIELQRYKQAGGGTLVDQTNRGLAQDPLAVKDPAERSGVQVILGCGWERGTFYEPFLYRSNNEQIVEQNGHHIT